MAKFIFTPGKDFKSAPKAVKLTYVALAATGAITIADAFLQGGLIGLYHGLSGWGFLVLGVIVGYLFYDTGNTLVRNRKLAKDIAVVFSVALIGIGIWRVIDGIFLGAGSVALGLLVLFLATRNGVKEFLENK